MNGGILAAAVFLGACAEPEATDDATEPLPEDLYDFAEAKPWYECPKKRDLPESAVEVVAIDGIHQYFGSENTRDVDVEVDFPTGETWSQVGLRFELECPDGMECDDWDRAGTLQLVLNPDDAPEDREYLELLRHITPYGVGMCQYVDITPLAGLIAGPQILASHIDTWVGPGHDQGEGWKVSASFFFVPGPDASAEVTNIWGHRSITVGEVEPESNVDSQVDPVAFEIPADATQVLAHLTTTGHSFGNSLNCAEFCEMRHDVIVNGEVHSENPWRKNCDKNPVSPQYGTWEYPRNGWCPGAVAVGDLIDITDAVTLGGDNELDFDILLATGLEYDNTQPVDLLPTTRTALRLYVYR